MSTILNLHWLVCQNCARICRCSVLQSHIHKTSSWHAVKLVVPAKGDAFCTKSQSSLVRMTGGCLSLPRVLRWSWTQSQSIPQHAWHVFKGDLRVYKDRVRWGTVRLFAFYHNFFVTFYYYYLRISSNENSRSHSFDIQFMCHLMEWCSSLPCVHQLQTMCYCATT